MAMGESSTCLMHSFSYTSGISSDAQEEGSPMYDYADSVSFGRFMTEPLAWEKWSAFSRNRYVDEAKSYSKPGSVAQKKAYFEAHFKRMAALKAAALLEQQAKNNNSDVVSYSLSSTQQQQKLSGGGGGIQAAAALLEHRMKNGNSELGSGNEAVVVVDTAIDTGKLVGVDGNDCINEVYHDAIEGSPPQKPSLKVEMVEDNDDHQPEFEIGDGEAATENKPPVSSSSCLSGPELERDEKVDDEITEDAGTLGLKVVNYDKPRISDVTAIQTKPSEKTEPQTGFVRTSDVSLSSQRSSCTDIIMDWGLAKAAVENQKPTTSSIQEEEEEEVVVVVTETTPTIPKTKNPPLSQFIPAVEISSAVSPSSSPARSARQQIHPGKENLATPTTTTGKKKSWLSHHHHNNETTESSSSSNNKKRTPLRMAINREFNRLISPVIKKIGSSSKSKPSVDRATDYPSEIPQSGRRRARALFDSSTASESNAQAVGPRGEQTTTTTPSADSAKSPSRIKTGTPAMSKFCLRRRDKSAQRRQENLDDNGQQQPSKSKGKKSKETNKLRHSFCFGARLSSESFRERDRSMRANAVNNTTSTTEAETLQNGTAGSSTLPPPRNSALLTSHQNKTSHYHSSTSS